MLFEFSDENHMEWMVLRLIKIFNINIEYYENIKKNIAAKIRDFGCYIIEGDPYQASELNEEILNTVGRI